MEDFSLAELRVFDYIARSMERLGYLKRLLKRVSATSTSNFENLGKDLVNAVSQKIRVPITKERLEYINTRVRGDILKSIKQQIDVWLKGEGEPPDVLIEIQDLYLADPTIPSQVGRLVEDNWRRYPALGTNLGLIRKGTYSLNTRGVSLLHFISNDELEAFNRYYPEHNPLLISEQQRILLLYSFIENDGEVAIPLWTQIYKSGSVQFTEKEAGKLLPNIYRRVIARHRTRLLSIDIRERLNVIEETARNIEKVTLSDKGYGGTSPREVAIRPRIEPYVDMGLFSKPRSMKYEYAFSEVGLRWLAAFNGDEDSQEISDFIAWRFFHAVAQAWQIEARELKTPDEIVPYLQKAAKAVSSTSGYTPIEELALVGGIWALTEDHTIMEPGVARDALIAYQKINPYKVRFTVDRHGTLAHARFIDESSPL
jgi:hypothetical protein